MMDRIDCSQIYEIFQEHSKQQINRIIEENPNLTTQEICEIISRTQPEPEIDPKVYKIYQCDDALCSQRLCPKYHNQLERRRDPKKVKYSSGPCYNVYKRGEWKNPDNCSRKEECTFSHTENEMKYHPSNIGETKDAPRIQPQVQHQLEENKDDPARRVQQLREQLNKKNLEVEETKIKLKRTEGEVKKLKVLSRCKACGEGEQDWILFPCSHLLCTDCVKHYSSVCFCNQKVESRIPLLSTSIR